MAVCEGNSRGTQPKDRASSVSPRYEIWNKGSHRGPCSSWSRFHDRSLRGNRLCIGDVWTASDASTCARHGWATTP